MKQLCDYLNITQILTGGHNPRGNAICERANQTLGAMIRKLNDQEYKELRNHIPEFKFAMNITPHSAIGCSPFEAGHGLPATTLSSARLLVSRYILSSQSPRGARMVLKIVNLAFYKEK
jgi:hypothetical protein